MKKILSFVLATAFLLTGMVPVAFAANKWTPHDTEPDLRIGVMSDMHFAPTATTETADYIDTKEALEAIKVISGNQNPDVLVMNGDLVAHINGGTSHYDLLNDLLDEILPGVPKVSSMGNHEYQGASASVARQTFEEKMNQEINYHTEVNGFHIITVSPDETATPTNSDMKSLPAATEEWLMAEIDKAIAEDSTNANADGTFDEGVIPDSTKPVFVPIHIPVDEIAYTYNADGTKKYIGGTNKTSDTLEAFLRNRPQVVHLFGHLHFSAQDVKSIWQDGFTAIGTPWVAASGYFPSNENAMDEVTKPTWTEGQVIEVENNVVKVYRYNTATGKYIGDPLTVDIPAIVADRIDDNPDNDDNHYLYSEKKREQISAPQFKEGAEIEIERVSTDSVTYSISMSDTTFTDNGLPGEGLLYMVRAEVQDTSGNVVGSAKRISDFWNNKSRYMRTFTGLMPGGTYKLLIYPVGPLAHEGNPIETTFTTATELNNGDNTLLYEFEDYCDYDGTSAYASGGKMASVSQYNAFMPDVTNHLSDDDPSFSFEINIPKAGTYTVEYAINGTNSGNASTVELLVDGVSLGTGHKNDTAASNYIAADMSGSGYDEEMKITVYGKYPWYNIPLKKFSKTITFDTAGTHTVTANISRCQVSNVNYADKGGIFLFAMDYIKFIPHEPILPEGTEISKLSQNAAVSVGAESVTELASAQNLKNATDGDSTTSYYSESGYEGAYIQMDLGAPKHISQINYQPADLTNCGKYIEIQVSNYADFRSYKVVKRVGSISLATDSETEVHLAPESNKYRYVRVARTGGIGYGVANAAEFSVYGYESSDEIMYENLIKSVSIANGTEGLTNVDNSLVTGPWTAGMKNRTYDGGKPISIQFADSVDTQSINKSNIKLSIVDASTSPETVTAVDYTPVIDAKNGTLKIDLSELEGYVGTHHATLKKKYRLEITDGIKSADGTFVNVAQTIEFTTNMIAKAPYVEGKVIRNVAFQKSAKYKDAPTWGSSPYNSTEADAAIGYGLIGRQATYYTNGALGRDTTLNGSTTGVQVAEPDNVTRYRVLVSDNPVLMDLGNEYEVVGIAYAAKLSYHYDRISHYLLKTPTYDTTGLTSVWDVPEGDPDLCGTKAVSTGETSRYLLVTTTAKMYPQEIMVFAYVDSGAPYTYFTSPVTLADDGKTIVTNIQVNAQYAGENTLILAEYIQSDNGLRFANLQSVTAVNGSAMLSVQKKEGRVYKMFLWNSLSGAIPITDTIIFE